MKLFVTLSVAAAAVVTTVQASLIPATPTLHIFGDSLSDVGTLQKLTLGLLPPPPYWKGRFSSGPVWNEYLAKLRNYDLYNKAIGGSTSDNKNSALLDFSPIKLPVNIPSTQDQINFFKAIKPLYAASLTRASDIAVLEMFNLATNTLTVSSFVETLSNTVVAQLEQLRAIGFKNIIVADMAAIQYTPFADILDMQDMANATVSLYNQQLAQKVNAWASSHAKDLSLFAIAEIGKFVEITANSNAIQLALGLTNVKTSCVGGNVLNLVQADNKLIALLQLLLDAKEDLMCSNPSTNYFFDFVHPAERIQRLFGYFSHEMINAVQKGSTLALTEDTILGLIKKYNLGTPAPKPVQV
ncbi:hypothetical protein IWW55_000137 [Coemansia sp. RSA 2706]|nr:hypothetical protein LPJ63_001904 [Coemansia sp. RSA 2711]KAJ2308931.1 hypothetical protein IWW55_000137 [Coemansia sp. RSA 2706]KAJ2315271.1 hypothetical protein IWW54_000397 [Coemansia sp. RSA 2705]KAJ2369709.1 hypothetical protein H4S01_000834 [Coemansia sp. RSA 2610]KAJ2392890.1 hypothetical protein H4S02_000532 [Coemansia sp. RSA 2611]KAJ2739918.1 hypothetical protein H4R23_000102 [Coemansia sp. Cherry 401B]